MIDYDKFEKSLKHLEAQYGNYRNLGERDSLTDLDREAIAESVIQRFETCYDTLWKHLKRYLFEELGVPEIPNSPKGVFRLANENHLLAGSIDHWLHYADARVSTAHDYSGEKAKACLELMTDFIDDAIGLYQTLSGKSW